MTTKYKTCKRMSLKILTQPSNLTSHIYFIRKRVIPFAFHLIQMSVFVPVFLLSHSFRITSPLIAIVLVLFSCSPPLNSITRLLFYDVVVRDDDGFILSSLCLTRLSHPSFFMLGLQIYSLVLLLSPG